MGVQSTCGVRSGRLVGQHVASVLHAYHVLDATCQIIWRPFRTTSPFWTPSALTTGVHSAQLPQSGRLSHSHMASAPHSFPDLDAMQHLDATHSITRRPFCSASPIWTPHTQSHGVQFCCSSQVGRHSTRTLASIPAALPNLDAIRTITRRPFCTPIMFWTPLARLYGVHSAQLPQSGRH